jgi:hypothetical protein
MKASVIEMACGSGESLAAAKLKTKRNGEMAAKISMASGAAIANQ